MRNARDMVIRLILIITLVNSLVLTLIVGYNYQQSRSLLMRELSANAQHLATALVSRIEIKLATIARTTESLARSLTTSDPGERGLRELIRQTVEGNPDIFGSTVAFEPQAFRKGVALYAPYYFRSPEGVSFMDLATGYGDLPYPQWDWYQIPKASGQLEWSEPYFDDGGGNVVMTTCSVPFFGMRDGQRTMRGIVTTDVAINDLADMVASVKILETGYATLLSRNGLVLAHPERSRIMNEVMFRNDSPMRAVGKKMSRGESGFEPFEADGARSWVYYAPVGATGWTIAVVFPEAELLANVNRLSLNMTVMAIIGILLITTTVVGVTRKLVGRG